VIQVGVEVGVGADLVEPAGKRIGIGGGGKAKAARTAWEVLASSVSLFFFDDEGGKVPRPSSASEGKFSTATNLVS
jgi:hypothetical protein